MSKYIVLFVIGYAVLFLSACGQEVTVSNTDARPHAPQVTLGGPDKYALGGPDKYGVAASNPCDCHTSDPLGYGGGRIIPRPVIEVVFWKGTEVPVMQFAELPKFYQDIVQSVYSDWLVEYNTSNQLFGRGYVEGAFYITPSVDKAVYTQTEIETQLDLQMGLGLLPQSDANTLYVVHMPPGVTINRSLDTVSCTGTSNGYHWDYTGQHALFNPVHYAIIADQSCKSTNPDSQFAQLTEVASHEVIEAMTNPEPGLTNYGWDECVAGGCESADKCDLVPAEVVAINHSRPEIPSHNYAVVPQWSNTAPGCVTRKYSSAFDLIWRSTSTGNPDFWLMSGTLHTDKPGPQGPQPPSSWALVASGEFAQGNNLGADGYSDLLWFNSSTNQYNVQWLTKGTFLGSFTLAGPVPAPNPYTFRAAADFDGDGISDLLFTTQQTPDITGVMIWLMKPNFTLKQAVQPGSVPNTMVFLGVGDFNRDGTADILWRQGTLGTVWEMNGGQILHQLNTAAISSNLQFLGIADFDADGVSDIAWKDVTSPVLPRAALWWMDPSTLAPKPNSPSTSWPSSVWTLLTVADVSGDGRADWVWLTARNGAVGLWITTSLNQFGSMVGSGTQSSDFVLKAVGALD